MLYIFVKDIDVVATAGITEAIAEYLEIGDLLTNYEWVKSRRGNENRLK